MNDFLIITGGNDKYIDTLILFVNHFHKLSIDNSNLIIHDLGLNKTNIEKINMIIPNVTICKLDYSKYPQHVNFLNYDFLHNSYAFKPICIWNTAQNAQKPIIWFDSCVRFNISHLIKIKSIIEKDGLWTTMSNNAKTEQTIELNHRDTLKHFNISDYEHENLLITRLGGLCGFDYNHKNGKHILDEWYKYSLIENIITPPNSSRNNHRQDQTLLSAIIFNYEKTYNIKFNICKMWRSNENQKLIWSNKVKIHNSLPGYTYYDRIHIETNQKAKQAVYCKTNNEAVEIYANRLHISKDELLKKYKIIISK